VCSRGLGRADRQLGVAARDRVHPHREDVADLGRLAALRAPARCRRGPTA
jgi:hypothetical protein